MSTGRGRRRRRRRRRHAHGHGHGHGPNRAETTPGHSRVQAVGRGVGHAVGNQDGNDEAVDGNDTSHDHGDDGLHDELGAHDGHGGDTGAGLGGTVGGAQGWRGGGGVVRRGTTTHAERRRLLRGKAPEMRHLALVQGQRSRIQDAKEGRRGAQAHVLERSSTRLVIWGRKKKKGASRRLAHRSGRQSMAAGACAPQRQG